MTLTPFQLNKHLITSPSDPKLYQQEGNILSDPSIVPVIQVPSANATDSKVQQNLVQQQQQNTTEDKINKEESDNEEEYDPSMDLALKEECQIHQISKIRFKKTR